ncbi:TfuA-like protein [Streptomyces sp. NPDC057939]|uniref:TfuA-like protein n=1 Tax=Streptomyces sp. NPDC057939 TaxID=3346284 RepID=UPI0036ECF383
MTTGRATHSDRTTSAVHTPHTDHASHASHANGTTRTVVTVGPTLTRAEVLRYLPGAEVREPVAAGQVLRWGLRAGDRLLVIDGLFLQSRAVRHKELLALLDQGVEVYGASSMGALRAAELAPFGMVGIGSVFRAYRDGEIVADDEVALVHADAEADHRPLGWALVDLRHAVRHAVRTGTIGRATGDLIVDAARRLPFSWRDSPTVLDAARRSGGDTGELGAFAAGYARGGPRIKRRDALTAVRHLASRPGRGPGERPRVDGDSGRLTYRGLPTPLSETVFLRAWRSTPLPRPAAVPPGGHVPAPAAGAGSTGPVPVPDNGSADRAPSAGPADVGCEQVAEAMALTWPGFPDFLRDLAARELLATLEGPEPGPEPAPRTGDVMAELAAGLRALRLPTDGPGDAPYAELLRPRERALPTVRASALLATRMWRATTLLDWLTPVVAALVDHPAFARTAADLVAARAVVVPAEEEESQTAAQCARLLRAWRVADATEVLPALRERGFLDLADFVGTVRAHLPFLVASAAEPAAP